MFDAFVVVLRELAELILILYALLASLRSRNGDQLMPWVCAGTVAGLAIAAVLCGWLLSDAVDPRWTAGLTLVLAFGVAVMASTLLATARAIQLRVQTFVEESALQPAAPAVVFFFAMVAAFREALEAGLFLRAVAQDDTWVAVTWGAVLGCLSAVVLAAASRRIGIRVGALAAFRVSALLLSLLTIQMMLGSLHELAHVQGADPAFWTRLSPILPDGAWYGWACTLLMLIPLTYMVRGWWFETARPVS